MAVLGRDFDLLVDHGRFFSLLGLWFLGPALDTIARKPGHDKATRLFGNKGGLEQRRPDRHCLVLPTLCSEAET
jgi:hypothetical protein